MVMLLAVVIEQCYVVAVRCSASRFISTTQTDTVQASAYIEDKMSKINSSIYSKVIKGIVQPKMKIS